MLQSRSHLVVTVLLCTLLCSPIPVPAVEASDPQPPDTSAGGHAAEQPDRPDFTVAPRSERLRNYPCSMCHQFVPPNPEPRALTVKHPMLQHGNGDIWCSTCHDMETPDRLSSGIVKDVVFDDAHVICGHCHAQQREDWLYGGHRKRVDNWQGERELHGCVHCHDPHAPAITPRKPEPPPPVRAGLERPKNTGHPAKTIWERYARELIEADREQAGGAFASQLRTTSFGDLAVTTSQDEE